MGRVRKFCSAVWGGLCTICRAIPPLPIGNLRFIVWVFFHQKPERKAYVAIVICMLGMAVLTGVFSRGVSLHLGDLLTIISAGFYALQIVYFGMSATKSSPWIIAFMLGLTQGVFGLGYSLLFETHTYAQVHWLQGLDQ